MDHFSQLTECNRVMVASPRNQYPQPAVAQILLVAFAASLNVGDDTMNEKIQPSQSGSGAQKDQKAAEEQRLQKEQSKADKPAETGSSSNSLPGSGPG
jgi:hypothetical protein